MKAYLESCLIEILSKSVGGLSVGTILREMRQYKPDLERDALQDLLRELVNGGRLTYTLRLGSTCVALGGHRPLCVSPRLYLSTSPTGAPPPGALCVRVLAGTAFGAGDHPTTCLMLRALEQAIAGMGSSGAAAQARALDVGTGNGVLAIAALLLGVGTAVGLDIDYQACREARVNARENGVARRCGIITGSVEALGQVRFDLVFANLRPPTLAALLPRLGSLLTEEGVLILSGFRCNERAGLEICLPEEMGVVWRDDDRDWAAIVVRRGPPVFRPDLAPDKKGG